MTYKEWRQCGRKRRYRDEHVANIYRKMFEKERGTRLDYYWCEYCKGFHLTSMTDYVFDYYKPELIAQ